MVMTNGIDLAAARPFLIYYATAALGVFVFLGRFSSPNKRFRRIRLRDDLDKLSIAVVENSNDDAATNVPLTSATSSSSSSSSSSPNNKVMKRKLSFLQANNMSMHNPFMNQSWELKLLERLKCALVAPVLLPPRLVLLLVSVLGAYAFGTLSTIGADLNCPLPKWRVYAQAPMKLCARGIMFALGYHYVHVKGRKASPQEAPVVVSNHVSFCEAIYLPGRLLSMAVSRRENAQIPVFGALMRHVQCIFVSRTDKDSRTTVANEICRRTKTERGQWHRQLLVFPEGTTTNNTAVISFKVGAFAPGVPVQPVAVRYGSNQTCDPSWVSGGPYPGELLFKLLCQPYNSMSVTFLPVYEPSPQEIKDPVLFATNVRSCIASELGVPASDHTFDDVLLLMEAKKLGFKGGLKEMITELANMKKILMIDLPRAKEYLAKFASLDTQKKGGITYEEFIHSFGSKDTDALRSLFCVLDVQDKGVINFTEYTTGLALLNEQGTGAFDDAMKLVFRVQDSRGEGRLSKEDTAKCLRKLWPDLTQELLDQTFAAADQDKDGTLSAAEFLSLARQNQHLWPSVKSAMFV